MSTLISLPASSFIGDQDAQLVTGDAAASHINLVGRPALAFDDTEEEAAVSVEFEMPSQYSGSGLTATVHFAMASEEMMNVAIDIFVEAKTSDSDALDMESASGWGSVNSGTMQVDSAAEGAPQTLDITLSNNDSVAVGDLVRIGIRRDADHETDDDHAGDMFVFCVTLEDDG